MGVKGLGLHLWFLVISLQKLFSKIWVAKCIVWLICEYSLSATAYSNHFLFYVPDYYFNSDTIVDESSIYLFIISNNISPHSLQAWYLAYCIEISLHWKGNKKRISAEKSESHIHTICDTYIHTCALFMLKIHSVAVELIPSRK